jgi:putative chitinase
METKVLEIIGKYPTLLTKYGLTTTLRKAHFFAQIAHESHLLPISENLNYSAKGLLSTFSKYFKTEADAKAYERQPEKIANRVYANRMGNGDEKSGDGWKFRGRGFIQITGKNNYESLSKDTSQDFIKNPEALLTEANSLLSALWFWKKNNLNLLADQDNVTEITKKINGGDNGLADRKALLVKFKNVIK